MNSYPENVMTFAPLRILLLLSLLPAATADPISPPMLGKLVDVGGYRVHVYCTGDGSPTVVVAASSFSFDWALVQPAIAPGARICTYDSAGMAWSDQLKTDPYPSCSGRVHELRAPLTNANVKGPYVLVGFSIGGLVARLYASEYPEDIAGLVIVDHAFVDTPESSPPAASSAVALDSPPVLLSKTPIALDMQDDENFSRLPRKDQELHRWALAIHSTRPTAGMAGRCFFEVNASEQERNFPLGDKPVAVVSTLYDSPRYTELQNGLLLLSRNSRQFMADKSSHMVIIDQPEIVVTAIQREKQAARSGGSLER